MKITHIKRVGDNFQVRVEAIEKVDIQIALNTKTPIGRSMTHKQYNTGECKLINTTREHTQVEFVDISKAEAMTIYQNSEIHNIVEQFDGWVAELKDGNDE